MTPSEASNIQNESQVYANLYSNLVSKQHPPKFSVGDKVRISKYKRKVFDKGFTPNWWEEIFVVERVVNTNPITYKLANTKGESITGSFYQQELKITHQDVFRIEKVIRQEKKKALVKWSSYPTKFNSWVPLSDLQKLVKTR